MNKYLDADQIDDLVGQVNYRPGWTFEVFVHPFEGLCLRIALVVVNAYVESEDQTQVLNIPVPPIISVEHFHDWLQWRLGRFELHELNEFYRVGGEIRHNPHAEEYWNLRS